MNFKSIVNRLLLVLLSVIGFFMGILPEGVMISEIVLTAQQWLGLLGVIIGAYMSPSLNMATVNVVKDVVKGGGPGGMH